MQSWILFHTEVRTACYYNSITDDPTDIRTEDHTQLSSDLWVNIWLFRADFCVAWNGQYEQTKTLSPMCLRKWTFKELLCEAL